MNEAEDLMQLAGEYVLGTLNFEQRQEVERRLPDEAALRAAVAHWEQRLLPLTALAEPVQPSSQLWQRIERSLPMLTPQRVREAGGWREWWNSLMFWRWLAAGSFATAVALGALVGVRMANPPATPGFMVVLVAPQDKAPGWVVQTGSSGGGNDQLNLIPLATVNVPQQKSLQFWTKGNDWKGPVSLGLVKPGQSQRINLDRLPPLQADQLFEITLEPETGSPIGRPTGPILYIGRAVKLT
jgi:anti-sigma-K factor RskA